MKQKQTGSILVVIAKIVLVIAILLIIGIPIALKVTADSTEQAYQEQIELMNERECES